MSISSDDERVTKFCDNLVENYIDDGSKFNIPDTSVLLQHVTMFLDCVENIRQKFKHDIGFLD